MYIVWSKWKPMPGNEAKFEEIGQRMRELLRKTDGVDLIEAFAGADGVRNVVHIYKDKAAYDAIVSDENSPFNKAAAAENIEGVAEWLGSESGEAIV